jgi:DNA invertase Pin-like site-specific DNA recombinase
MTGRLIGYARCSTDDQKAGLEQQIRDLTAADCDLIFNEEVSSVADRAELDAAMAELRPGDTLVVCKLDRLARSVMQTLEIANFLEKNGCSLRILNFGGDVLDTRSATGKLILTMFAGFAEFERNIMLERQKIGITKARAEGKYRGRKPKEGGAEARALFKSGLTVADVSRSLGVSRTAVYRMLGEAPTHN